MLEYVKNVVVMTRTRRGRCEELSYLISPICKLHLERARKTTWSPGFQVLLPKDSKDSDFLSAATTECSQRSFTGKELALRQKYLGARPPIQTRTEALPTCRPSEAMRR